MKLTKEEISQIAHLARLKLNPKDLEKYRKQLSEVLDYVSRVKKFIGQNNGSGEALLVENVLREDKIIACPIEPLELLKNAPELKEGFVKTPPVLESQDSKS